MAITQKTIGINTANAGTWTNADVINQLEEGFAWLGWHGQTQTGLCVGISTFSGGGIAGNTSDNYEDVRPISTTGIGTGASFFVDRHNGRIDTIHVNRPGYGYTGGEIVTLSAEDIGGSSNGATNMQVKVVVPGIINNTVSYAVTFTSIYNASGTDRNGTVSGTSTTITIREGDTLSLTHNSSSDSYNAGVSILWNADNTTGAATTNYVFNVTNQGNVSLGQTTTWTPLPGQSGTYFIRSYSAGIYSSQSPRIIVLPASQSDISYVGYGSITSFYDKKTNDTDPYGVLRHTIQSGKRYGDTYRGFLFRNEDSVGTKLYLFAGSGFFPGWNSTNSSYNGGHAYGRRFAGSRWLDLSIYDLFSNYNSLEDADYSHQQSQTSTSDSILTIGGNTTFQLDLNIYRSSLDPRFAVLSFRAPTKSSVCLTDNTYGTFFFHNFTTDVWDLDHLFLGGFTHIVPTGGNAGVPNLQFVTYLTGMKRDWASYSAMDASKRTAEFGYCAQYFDNNYNYINYVTIQNYSGITNNYYGGIVNSSRIYHRNADNAGRSRGGYQSPVTGNDSISSSANYNAVIKGLPLNGNLIPCPYYIPDDFVLIQFDYPSPEQNIQQGDTITISGSEVYTVITGSYNRTTRTRGILFCARTV